MLSTEYSASTSVYRLIILKYRLNTDSHLKKIQTVYGLHLTKIQTSAKKTHYYKNLKKNGLVSVLCCCLCAKVSWLDAGCWANSKQIIYKVMENLL